MADGKITREDIITDEALNWGPDYAKALQAAIDKQKEFVEGILATKKESDALRKSQNQDDYKNSLNAVNLESKKTIAALKEQLVVEVSLEKIKKEKIQNSKLELDLDVKKAKAAAEISKLMADEEKLAQQKLKTEKDKLAIEKQLVEIETKKQQLKAAGITVAKAELDLLQKEENLKKTKLKQLEDEENKIKTLQAATKQNINVWKEQNQLELALISTKRKNELATEGTAKALIKERTELNETNRVTKLHVIANQSLNGSYNKIQSQLSINITKWKEMSKAERETTNEGKQLTATILKQENALKNLDSQVGRNQRNVGNYGSALNTLRSSAGNLLGAFGVVGGVSAIASITMDIFKQTKELQALDLAMQTVTGTQKNFSDQQQFLRRIALAYGADINSLTSSFVSFYASAKDKLAGKDIQNIFESVTKAGGVLGLSVERQEKAFLALNQMMSKGTIQAEELRGQLSEALPNSMGIMTKAVQALNPGMIVTEKTLADMMKSGKLLSAEVLPEFARQMQIAYGIENVTRVETLSASQNRLTNRYKDFIRSLNESDPGPVTKFFKFFIDTATNALNVMIRLNSSWDQLYAKSAAKGGEVGVESFDKQLKSRKSISGDFMSDADYSKLIKDQAIKELKIFQEQEKKLDKEMAEFNPYALNFGKSGKDMKKEKEQLIFDISARARIIKEANNKIQSSEKPKPKAAAAEETAEQKAAREKAAKAAEKEAKDAEERAKQLRDALYNLEKQRLEQSIKTNDDIVANDKLTDEIRIQAAYTSQAKQEDLVQLNKNYLLSNEKLVANDRIRIKEDAANKIVSIEDKTIKEVEKLRLFDEKEFVADLVKKTTMNEISADKAMEAENEAYKIILDNKLLNQNELEKAAKKHEENLYNIKLASAKELAKILISNTELELAAYKQQSDGSEKSNAFILDLEKKLQDAKLKLSELGLDTFKKGEEQKVLTAKEVAVQTLEISMEVTGELANLANAFSEAKIQKLDDEINKNNEFYDKQIELAGNNEKQKDLLNKERDKKNDIAEKKKREAQHKQAVFDKAVNVAMVAMATALAVIKAYTEGDPYTKVARSILAGVTGAIQLAVVLATPIPKYKHGRKGGPAEWAEVGDGFVHEVISKADGSNARLTPNVPTLTHLEAGDVVHRSTDAYDDYVRKSVLSGLMDSNKNMNDFQRKQTADLYGKESLDVLKQTLDVIKKQKNKTVVHTQTVDISHLIWAANNKKW